MINAGSGSGIYRLSAGKFLTARDFCGLAKGCCEMGSPLSCSGSCSCSKGKAPHLSQDSDEKGRLFRRFEAKRSLRAHTIEKAAHDFLIEAPQSPVPHRRELLDQLDRACLSILLNTAEGNGKRQGPQRAKFFGDARGSALECAAGLDASLAKRIAKSDRIHSGKQLLIRIVAMLTSISPQSSSAAKRQANLVLVKRIPLWSKRSIFLDQQLTPQYSGDINRWSRYGATHW